MYEIVRTVLEARAIRANDQYGERWKTRLPEAQEAFETVVNPWFRAFKGSEAASVLTQLGYRGSRFTLATEPVFYPKHAIDELKVARGGRRKAFIEQARVATGNGIDVVNQGSDFSEEIWRAELYIGPAQREAGLFVSFTPTPTFLGGIQREIHDVYPIFHSDEQIVRGDFSSVDVLKRLQPDVIIGLAERIGDGTLQRRLEHYAALVIANHPLRTSLAEEIQGYRAVPPLVGFVDSCRGNGFSRNGTS